MSAVQVCSETRRALALSQFRILFFPLATESIFFGISTTMTFLAVICFFSKSIRGRHDFNLMTIICIMFAVGATHWGLRLAFTWNFAIVATLCTPLPSNMKAIQIATSNVQLINFILSDLVVVWRAWVLYDRARFVFVVSALLAIPSIALSFTNLALNVALPAPNMMSQAVTFTVLGLSFANNLWGTSLVALKTWCVPLFPVRAFRQ
ncbi:hypothetical protein OF83DRAFT_1180769 [Amylostereum chailletii]|nr:hypothetical protein OF83DRAFT_1180769 [Amylostereum chailletii]